MKNTLINKMTAVAVLSLVSLQTFASGQDGCPGGKACEVPEPGSIALLGAGIAAIAVSKYFKHRNK